MRNTAGANGLEVTSISTAMSSSNLLGLAMLWSLGRLARNLFEPFCAIFLHMLFTLNVHKISSLRQDFGIGVLFRFG